MLFCWPIRIYYEDTDARGVVYHARYAHFFERARTEMLREKGFQDGRLRRRLVTVFQFQLNPSTPKPPVSHSKAIKSKSATIGLLISRKRLIERYGVPQNRFMTIG